MKLNKANNRDRKYRKNRYGMVVSNRSIKIIQTVIIKKGKKGK